MNVARIGDTDSAGDTIVTGSLNVFANSIGVARIDDTDNDPWGNDTIMTGAPRVFVNNRAIARVGDTDSDGDVISTGSPNVFA